MSRHELFRRHYGVVDGIIEQGILVTDETAVLELIEEVDKLLPYIEEALGLLDFGVHLARYNTKLEHAYDYSTEVIQELVEVAIGEGDFGLAGTLRGVADGMQDLRPCL